MTQEDTKYRNEIIEIARQVGFNVSGKLILDDMGYVTITNRLEAFAKLVEERAAAKEREACALICDSFQARDVGMQPAECAGAIRARGEA